MTDPITTREAGYDDTRKAQEAAERNAAWDAYYKLTYLASLGASPRDLFGGMESCLHLHAHG